MERGEGMPQKETRESIEAELNASKRERIALQLQELVREAHLVEKDLRALEDEQDIPEFAWSRPLPERMAAVGMSRGVIDRISKFMDALDMVRQGRSDDLPDDVKKGTCRPGRRRVVRRRAAGGDCRPATEGLLTRPPDQATMASRALAPIDPTGRRRLIPSG
jgi:hypothetical protein